MSAAGSGNVTAAALIRRAAVAVVAVLGFAILVAARRPSAWSEPTIWAEDGQVFLARAWEGPAMLAEPYAGQFWLPQRALAMAIGVLPPTAWPLALYLVSAVAVGAVAAVPLLPRAAELFGHWGYRLALGLLIVATPAVFETQGNITNLHWWALAALLIVVALPPPVTRVVQVGELVLLGALALTGPLGLLALPVGMWRLVVTGRAGQPTGYLWWRTSVLAIGAGVGLAAAVAGERAAGNDVTIADVPAFLYLRWGGSLVAGDANLIAWQLGPDSPWLLAGALVMGVLVVLAILDYAGPSWLWLGVGLAAAVAGALVGMRAGDGASLLEPRNVERYLLVLLIASWYVMVRALGRGRRSAQVAAGVALGLSLVGVIGDARLPSQGEPVSRQQLADLPACYAGDPPFTEAIACTVEITPDGWRLVVFRPGYEGLRDQFREVLSP